MKKIKKLHLFIILLISSIAISVGSYTLAKYLADRNMGNQSIGSTDFYFTLDLIGDSNNYNQVSKEYELYGDKEKSIQFSVRNYFDDLRVNSMEFEYQLDVVVTSDDEYAPILSSVTENDKKFAFDVKEDETYKITFPSGFNNGTNVKVIASTSDPYEKELELSFTLFMHESAVTFRINDSVNSPYASLLIYCNEDVDKKDILIDWSKINVNANVFQIDMTNDYILDGNQFITNVVDENIGYLTSAYNTLSIKQGEVIEILFFKSNSSMNYSKDETSSVLEDEIFKIILD